MASATEVEDAQGTFTLLPSVNEGTRVGSVLFALPSTAAASVFAPVPTENNLLELSASSQHGLASLPEELPTVISASSEAEETPALALPAAPHGMMAVASVQSSASPSLLLSAVPQVAGAPVAAVLPGWQRLADQLFQALVSTSPRVFEPTLLIQSNPEHSQPGLAVSDHVDEGTWEEFGSAFTPAPGDWSAPLVRQLRREVVALSSSARSTGPLDQAALDQAFAQTVPENEDSLGID